MFYYQNIKNFLLYLGVGNFSTNADKKESSNTSLNNEGKEKNSNLQKTEPFSANATQQGKVND